MLTVEELVIESLYHRLVLINVKKPAASSPCSDGGTSLSEEVDDEAPASPSSPPHATAGLSATGTGGGLGEYIFNVNATTDPATQYISVGLIPVKLSDTVRDCIHMSLYFIRDECSSVQKPPCV